MKIINVTLIIRNDCSSCDDILNKLRFLQKSNKNIVLHIYNINEINNNESVLMKYKSLVTPAMFIEERLKLYGDESIDKLKKLICG